MATVHAAWLSEAEVDAMIYHYTLEQNRARDLDSPSMTALVEARLEYWQKVKKGEL